MNPWEFWFGQHKPEPIIYQTMKHTGFLWCPGSPFLCSCSFFFPSRLNTGPSPTRRTLFTLDMCPEMTRTVPSNYGVPTIHMLFTQCRSGVGSDFKTFWVALSALWDWYSVLPFYRWQNWHSQREIICQKPHSTRGIGWKLSLLFVWLLSPFPLLFQSTSQWVAKSI